MDATTDGEILAAVDLGSNTFQVLVARVTTNSVTEIDRIKVKVGLAERFTADGAIDDVSMERATQALEQLGARLHGFAPTHVRAVGTHALRRATNAGTLLERGRLALGFPIEVVSPEEEARLVYLGVTRTAPGEPGRRLVLDIGGGSSEVILGDAAGPIASESYSMGCGSWTRRYFPEGRVTSGAFDAAEAAASMELASLPAVFTEAPARCLGGSGTIRSTQILVGHHGWSEGRITRAALDRLADELLKVGDPDQLWVAPISQSRMSVLAGGVAILRAFVRRLGVEHVIAARGGLRDGVVLDLRDRSQAPEISSHSDR